MTKRFLLKKWPSYLHILADMYYKDNVQNPGLYKIPRNCIECQRNKNIKYKTKTVLQTRTQSGETQQLRIDDQNIQAVDSFVYLGSCITKDNDEYIEIQRRLKLANKAYFLLLAVLRCKDIHTKTKVMLYKTLIRTDLT
jgi:hypothetical protein